MKIRYLSDLHLEFTCYSPQVLPSVGEDVVVLAGDIAVGTRGIEWALRAIKDRPVIYVLGNHEFFGEDFNQLIDEAHLMASGTHVHLLENESVVLQGLRILGCSLWTDYLCFGEDRREEAESDCWEIMRDFDLIRCADSGTLTPSVARRRCVQSRNWLDQQIAQDPTTPTLVVTHHGPTLANTHPSFLGQATNGGFHNAFEALIRPPVVAWIHGHHHYCGQHQVNDIPVLSNQRGYPNEYTGDFSWDRLLDLEVRP